MRPCFCTCCFTVFVFCCFTFWFTINCHLRLEVIFRVGSGSKTPTYITHHHIRPCKGHNHNPAHHMKPCKILNHGQNSSFGEWLKIIGQGQRRAWFDNFELLDKLQVSLILCSGGFLLIASPQCLSWSPPRPTILTNMFGNIRIGGSRRDIIHD